MSVLETLLGTQQPETPVALSYEDYFVDEILSRNEGREPHQSIEDYSITGCLLYTSPSPRDLSTSRMPSSA